MFDEIQSWAAMQTLAESKRVHAEALARLQKCRDKEGEILDLVLSAVKQVNAAKDAIEDMCGEK